MSRKGMKTTSYLDRMLFIVLGMRFCCRRADANKNERGYYQGSRVVPNANDCIHMIRVYITCGMAHKNTIPTPYVHTYM